MAGSAVKGTERPDTPSMNQFHAEEFLRDANIHELGADTTVNMFANQSSSQELVAEAAPKRAPADSARVA